MCGPEYSSDECRHCICANCMRRDCIKNRERMPAKEIGCLSCTACMDDGGRIAVTPGECCDSPIFDSEAVWGIKSLDDL